MSNESLISRRTALAGGVAGVGALTLAACGTSSGASGGSGSSGGAGGGASQAGQTVTKLSDITIGEAVSAKIDGKDVLVGRPTATTAVCFSAICTHQGCTVQPAGKQLDCPCHGSVFDAKTGAVVQGPAPSPLEKIAVTVKNGSVVTT